ncbi:hypothetical protein ACSSWA_06895 [Melioribacter sp. Ez-97]|uniref:hypothetical protein n=1 Tax=Melioribacter sp. Ez-97 TaxID=3423434 RepID=UPI003EDB0048
MFEREIKFIYDFNLNKINRLGTYFTYEQLKNLELHPAILNYISAEIDYIIFEDRQKLLSSSVFDYSGEKISHYFSLINEEVKRTKKLSSDFVSKLLLHASSFNVNFLARPRWTLTKFIFDENNHRTGIEIKQILNYLYYYSYLKKIICSYIDKKKIISLNSEEFSELLQKIDDIGKETNLQSLLSGALKSMADFFNIGELQKNKVPLLAIEEFLKEKGLERHIKKLRIMYGDDKSIRCNVKDLMKEFGAILPSVEENVQEKENEELEEENVEETVEINKVDSSEIEKKIEEHDSVNITREELEENKDEKIEAEESEELEEANEEETLFDGHPEDVETKEESIEQTADREENAESDEDEIHEQEDIVEEEVSITYKPPNVDIHIVDEEEEIQENGETPEQEEEEITLLKRAEPDEQIEKTKEEEEEPDAVQNNEKDNVEKIDLNKLLENKDINKIIEVIFDYDIEEFTNVIENVSRSKDIYEAYAIINEALLNRNIDSAGKEAELFKSIISEHFGKES